MRLGSAESGSCSPYDLLSGCFLNSQNRALKPATKSPIQNSPAQRQGERNSASGQWRVWAWTIRFAVFPPVNTAHTQAAVQQNLQLLTLRSRQQPPRAPTGLVTQSRGTPGARGHWQCLQDTGGGGQGRVDRAALSEAAQAAPPSTAIAPGYDAVTYPVCQPAAPVTPVQPAPGTVARRGGTEVEGSKSSHSSTPAASSTGTAS